MAMTQLALVFMGVLAATLSGLGLLGPFNDDGTNVILSFIGAVVWGFFGLSSFDVIVFSSAYASQSEPIMPLVFLGVGLSIVVGVFSFHTLLKGVKDETEATTEGNML